MQRLDEEGVAYGWFMIYVFIFIIAALAFVLSLVLVNELIDFHNDQVGEGVLSLQTSDTFLFVLGLFIGIPGFALIGALLWAVNRAHKQRRYGA